jgi:hypothetical protein
VALDESKLLIVQRHANSRQIDTVRTPTPAIYPSKLINAGNAILVEPDPVSKALPRFDQEVRLKRLN